MNYSPNQTYLYCPSNIYADLEQLTISHNQCRRKPVHFLTITAVLLLMTALFRPVAATAAEGETTVSLGTVSGLPNSDVLMPVMLTPSPPELRIGEFKATIGFNNKLVSFLRAEKGFLLDGVNATFQTDLKADPKDPNHSLLILTVSTQGDPRKALRDGLILTLVFHISETAISESKIDIAVENVSATDLSAPPKAVQPVAGNKGIVEVIPPEQVPYVACFFFTH
jgi:hypothetical protein